MHEWKVRRPAFIELQTDKDFATLVMLRDHVNTGHWLDLTEIRVGFTIFRFT